MTAGYHTDGWGLCRLLNMVWLSSKGLGENGYLKYETLGKIVD